MAIRKRKSTTLAHVSKMRPRHKDPIETPITTNCTDSESHYHAGVSGHPEPPPEGLAPEPSPPGQAPDAGTSSAPSPPRTGPHRQVKTGTSDVLEKWRPLFPFLLEDILFTEADPNIPGPCSSCQSPATARCIECFGRRAACVACLCKSHVHMPFHWVEVWMSTHFVKTDLSSLGLSTYLGHNALPCPHLSAKSQPSKFVVTHTNGIHELSLYYCHCPGRPTEQSQLLRAHLFPATVEYPKSLFTFALLKEWHIHTLTSKKGAYDFVRALGHLTDNGFPHSVKNRYREFSMVSRVWRHLAMVKRSGNFHGLVLPGRDPALLTVPCYTCPWPGFNLPDKWKQVPAHLSYIYRIELGGDGNFGLQKKSKHDDPNDHSLAPHQGFFVDEVKMRPYLKQIEEEDPSNFSQRRAVGFRQGRLNDLENSDILTARGMVDLQKGERFGHMDFAFAGALEGLEDLAILFTYDVACIYEVNFRQRFERQFPHLADTVKHVTMKLPRMHMLAHKELCHTVYALCYAWGAGIVSGESVEHPWSEHNQVGLSTREMSAGGRHDTLNDFLSFWNWLKVQQMSLFLGRKLKEGLIGQERTTAYFRGLTALAGPDNVSEWEQMSTDAVVVGTGSRKKVESVYLLDRNAVPSTGKVYSELCEQEITAAQDKTNQAAVGVPPGAAQMIKTALEIEDQQCSLRFRAETAEDSDTQVEDSLSGQRDRLGRSLERLRKQQLDLAGDLSTLLPTDDVNGSSNDHPEDDLIGLPSDFTPEERSKYNLHLLARQELAMRLGRAYDLLAAVQEAVKHKAAFIQHKKDNARGQKDNLRAGVPIRMAEENCKRLAKTYNFNYAKLLVLSGPDLIIPPIVATPGIAEDAVMQVPKGKKRKRDDDLSSKASSPVLPAPAVTCRGLQLIDLSKDLVARDLQKARHLGDSKYEASWIWTTPIPAGATEHDMKAWSLEVSRVDWFRARAEKDRHDENVNKLHADFRHTIKAYRSMARLWTVAGERTDTSRGAQAFAHQKAAMFLRMAQECEEEYVESRRDKLDGEKLDYSLP
ncbi:hypothetical protein EUX98_g9037 [Antrodiella citrinella]|uniref:CxC2-like cysteine cluster KDZ transposase-associated domain-containing protein n=1 Tax=Antrodiella citrinella TaxID=2447956 RepID=A0A4S4LZ08_9APHY|nr:hypothetical protein EUX98_g9037 [Antrodiella citrinella]